MNAIQTSDYSTYPQIFATVSRKLIRVGIQTAIQDNLSSIIEFAQTNGYGKFLTLSKKFISYILNLLDNWQLEDFLLDEVKEMGI